MILLITIHNSFVAYSPSASTFGAKKLELMENDVVECEVSSSFTRGTGKVKL